MTVDHPFVYLESPGHATWKPIFHALLSRITRQAGFNARLRAPELYVRNEPPLKLQHSASNNFYQLNHGINPCVNR